MFANLDVEAYDREYTDRQLARRIAGYFGHQRGRAAVIAASTALLGLLSAAVPILISRGVQILAGQQDDARMLLLVALTLAAWVMIWVSNLVRRRAISRAIGDTVLAMRRDAFAAAVNQDLAFHDEFASGRIVSRITSDTQDFGQTVTLVADLVSQFLELIILVAVLFTISPRLTLVVLAWAPLVVGLALMWRKWSRQVTRQGNRAMAEVNSMIFESVAGISVAKNFRREATIYGEFDKVNWQSYGINVRRGLVLSAVFPVLNILVGLGIGMVVYLGARAVVAGALVIGTWYLFIQSIDAFFFPLLNLSSFWSQVQAGLSAVERVFALVDSEPSVIQRADDPVPHLNGEVEFDKITFRYGDEGDDVLSGFDLRIAPGETLALVGHTGAGKSSIARLIARAYEFQDGHLLIDGRDIRTLNLPDFRRRLGIVPQAPFLFSGTVADNIRYARPDMSDEEIEAVARRIGGGEWLDALPDGLQTDVGERGARLSMGERQLVALMRVLVQKPAIFILDEATASIDPFTEAQIQDALELILSGSTSIVIAHRLSTVEAADRIIVLERGRITEEGTHDSLMAAEGSYAELYNTYFRHQSPDYEVTADYDPPHGAVEGAPATGP
ncbi:MAG: ABC transporter ATP-binding protein [Anaerolineae bacterium]